MKEYFIICETDKEPYVVEYVTESETERGGTDFLKFINTYIDGLFEIVRPHNPALKSRTDGMLILCDEEGLLKELPLNLVGSCLYNNIIVGNIMIGRDGYFKGMPDVVGFDDKEYAERRCVTMRKIWEALNKLWEALNKL